jgi:hypothetical protein
MPEGTPEQFKIASLVRVKRSVAAPNDSNMPIGGWLGTVVQVSGNMCFVEWNEATRLAVHLAYRGRLGQGSCQCLQPLWLDAMALEADPGEPLRLE